MDILAVKIPKTWEELCAALLARSVRAHDSFLSAVEQEASDLIDQDICGKRVAMEKAQGFYLNDVVGFLEDERCHLAPYEILRLRRVHIAWAVSEVLRGAEDVA